MTPESVEEGGFTELPLPSPNSVGMMPSYSNSSMNSSSASRPQYGHVRGHSVAPSGDWRGLAEAARKASYSASSGGSGGGYTGRNGKEGAYGNVGSVPTVAASASVRPAARLRAKKVE